MLHMDETNGMKLDNNICDLRILIFYTHQEGRAAKWHIEIGLTP